MKKVYIILTLLVLILTACGAVSTPTHQADTVQEATAIAEIISATQAALAPIETVTAVLPGLSTLSTDYDNAVPIPMQLLIGILQLEDTDLAVTSSQAKSFLTVLNFLKEMSTNTSATQEQIDSLVAEAQSILTEEQIQAIAAMEITQEAARSALQKLGDGMGNPPQPPQGQMPPGTPLAGGPNGQPPSADRMGTPPTTGMGSNMGLVPPQLIDTLIQLMESKTEAS